jgi:hypothetical protein
MCHVGNDRDERPISEMQGSDWSAWAAEHAMRSPAFTADVERLRGLAREPHPRVGWAASDRTYAELFAAIDGHAGLRQPPRAWNRTGGGYGLEHVRRYVASLRAVARRRLGHEDYAAALHEHVRSGRPLALDPIGHPARWRGSVASRLAAHVTGASWTLGGATAIRQAWREHRPRNVSPMAGPEVSVRESCTFAVRGRR